MKLNLKRPIVFFDLETTGLNMNPVGGQVDASSRFR